MHTSNDFSGFFWINKPNEFDIQEDVIRMVTDPRTDFWQRTYYDFRNDNAHAFLISIQDDEFSFTVKTAFKPKNLFDQCGIVIYQDSDNWFKASVEYDNREYSRLGSVVTNLGYSDWASTDIDPNLTTMVYRLSRRGQDFLLENSENGDTFQQMRIFHMHEEIDPANIGIYACSPLDSSTEAVFSELSLGDCLWESFEEPG